MIVALTPGPSRWFEPALATPAAPSRGRLEAVDALRGLAMVLMALDHARVFFSAAHFDLADLRRTTVPLFLTRWVTHFCAPAFIFLTGAGAYLGCARGQSRAGLARFLLARGLWLVFLELTAVHFGWFFSLSYRVFFCQVIWAIGWSMVALAGLVFLPPHWVGAIGAAVVTLHGVVDRLAAQLPAVPQFLWRVVHDTGTRELLPGHRVVSSYPVLPWLGVMALGYGFGTVLLADRSRRRAWTLGLGTVLTLAFIVLRAAGLGDEPHAWEPGRDTATSALSFLNCCKYPPSPLFVLMTLGPSLLALGLLDREPGPLSRLLIAFGRAPLFFYLIHIPLLHAAAAAVTYLRHGYSEGLLQYPLFFAARDLPDGYGFGLTTVYLAWVAALPPLYLACRWFARVKQRRRAWWLRYL
jgi:uncharacterized membrane protein